jgi:hypothetical protein
VTRYASLAQTPEEERAGLSLRQAFVRLLVLVWQDNDPEQVESMWRTLAGRPGPFADEAVEVLDAVIAQPPDDLVELIRTHGWVPLTRREPDGPSSSFTRDEATAWLAQVRDRLAAIREDERPEPDGGAAGRPGAPLEP